MSGPRCPHCGAETIDIGYRIPVPAKAAVKQWQSLQHSLAVARSEHALASEHAAIRRIHDLERELAKLEALPGNPGRQSLIRRLSRELAQLRER